MSTTTSQDFISRVFDLSFSEQEKARIGDNRRERSRRAAICCAPDMCPTCFDNGGHER